MRVCGVELSANDAIICLLTLEDEIFDIPDCRVRKLSYDKLNNQESIKTFQFAFSKLMTDYKIETVVIRERPMKGKFSGGAIGFKLEAAIQLLEGVKVQLIAPADIKALIKRNPVPVSFSDTGLKVFQEPAFASAYGYLMQQTYGTEA
ncbi:MAG: DUF3010 family protein [Oleiphilus sp.]